MPYEFNIVSIMTSLNAIYTNGIPISCVASPTSDNNQIMK